MFLYSGKCPISKSSMDFVFVLVWFHLFVVPMFYMQTVVMVMLKHLKLTQIQKINRGFCEVTVWMRYQAIKVWWVGVFTVSCDI